MLGSVAATVVTDNSIGKYEVTPLVILVKIHPGIYDRTQTGSWNSFLSLIIMGTTKRNSRQEAIKLRLECSDW